jgi:divalent metal cation (Fe/Co/Zn/Cd) transporter
MTSLHLKSFGLRKTRAGSEAVLPAVQANLRRLASDAVGVSGVNEVLTMHFGPADVLAAFSLDFHDSLTAAQVERTVSALERRIKQVHPEIRRVFVEVQGRDEHLSAGQDVQGVPAASITARSTPGP